MPFEADFQKFTLDFISPMGTSRGVMTSRDTYIVSVKDTTSGELGLGECAPLPGLSPDPPERIETKLEELCQIFEKNEQVDPGLFADYPAVRFACENVLLDLKSGEQKIFFESGFTSGKTRLPTNGLIVMSDFDTMKSQVISKTNAGFRCIKIKVGAYDFEAECDFLAWIRKRFPPDMIELRLDANGAFKADEALLKLDRLSQFTIHSLEQPIKPRQHRAMQQICSESPIPIALDEELIGIGTTQQKHQLLQQLQPDFIILKPTLLGGIQASEEWVREATNLNIGYWVTSALESNIGLNNICQWAATFPVSFPQGLGTGVLYHKNFPSPVRLSGPELLFEPNNISAIKNPADLRLG